MGESITISAAIRRGLIEAPLYEIWTRHPGSISAAIRRGLIEAVDTQAMESAANAFPRPFAAASLKPPADRGRRRA